jgi:hypothetical protein
MPQYRRAVTLEEVQAGAGTDFLFHYTDAIRADAIIEEQCFVSGPRTARGFGIYATHIAPVGEETIEEVIVNCFRGDATPPEVNHAIAVRARAGDFGSSGPTIPTSGSCRPGGWSWCTSKGSTSPLSRSAAAVGRSSMRQIDNRL